MGQDMRMRHAYRLPHIGERHRRGPTIEEQPARRHPPLFANLGARTLAPFLVRPRLLVHPLFPCGPAPRDGLRPKALPESSALSPLSSRLQPSETRVINIDVNVT